MNLEQICLHQFNRPSRPCPGPKPEGVGECYNCQTHPDNKYCKNYTPITVTYYDVRNINPKHNH